MSVSPSFHLVHEHWSCSKTSCLRSLIDCSKVLTVGKNLLGALKSLMDELANWRLVPNCFINFLISCLSLEQLCASH